MIKPNEVVVGRIFNRELRRSVKKYDREFVLTENWIMRLFNYNDLSISLSDLRHIAITSDWLERLGFEKCEDNMWFNSRLGYLSKYKDGYTIPDSCGEPSVHYLIKYVNQIQDIYYAYTGEEIKVNEKLK